MAEKKQKQTFNTKLYECCAGADDKLRPLFQCVHFENGYGMATDGMVAIKQTLALQSVIDMEELDGKSLHRDNYRAAMTFEMVQATPEGLQCWNENGQKAFLEYYQLREGEKIPDINRAVNPLTGIKTLSFIGINPDNITRLCKALYAPGGNIRIQFTGVDTPIIVDVIGVDEQQGIVMPVILNDSLF